MAEIMSNREMAVARVHLIANKELSMSTVRFHHPRGYYIRGKQQVISGIVHEGALEF